MPPDTAAVGEIGLVGEVRRVSRLDTRVAEAARLDADLVCTELADKLVEESTCPVGGGRGCERRAPTFAAVGQERELADGQDLTPHFDQ